MPDRTIQNIFRCYANRLEHGRHPLKHLKAMDAIRHCRTPEMGVSYFSCPDRHRIHEQYHSCRHRSCFLCAQRKRAEWVEKQKNRLLDVPHFHVVFTLPHEYLPIWRYNDALMTRLIFQASQETLQTLLADCRYQGFTPGILMALHTWGRQLTLHPHTHCLVTAGGLTPAGDWKNAGDYLLPIRVVKSLYRGKFQALIREARQTGELRLPDAMSDVDFRQLHAALYRKAWSVRIEERYSHGKGVMLYLSRYLKGGPVHPRQIHCQADGSLSLRYLDHRDHRIKQLRLRPEDFLKRVLTHVPPPGCHTVRYYGLYAASAKARYRRCEARWGTVGKGPAHTVPRASSLLLYCKVCGEPVHRIYSAWPRRKKGNSIIRGAEHTDVQQENDADVTRATEYRLPHT